MKFTNHAHQRWHQRFPGRSMADEFATARRPGNAKRKKIARQLAAGARLFTRLAGRYFLVSKSGVVFVCAPPETVITVFPLTGTQDWKQSA